MILVGNDIGKNRHAYSIYCPDTGEAIEPEFFDNSHQGFDKLLSSIKAYDKDKLLIGMEDTGHYHFALLKYLLQRNFPVALINPITTDCQRRLSGSISKNDRLDCFTICDVLSLSEERSLIVFVKSTVLTCTNSAN